MDNAESKPIPDPTVLTVDLTRREINALKDLLECKIDCVIELVGKNYEINNNMLQGHIDEAAQRFRAIQIQFDERDKRFDLASRDSALATTKSETLATKQIDQLSNTITIALGNIEKQFNDIKERQNRTDERINKSEGYTKGSGGMWVGVSSVIASVISIGTFLILIVHLRG